MYQPPPSLSPDLQDTLSVPEETPYQVTTKETSQYANSIVTDLTLHTLQRQMDMMQSMMTQMCQLSDTTESNP